MEEIAVLFFEDDYQTGQTQQSDQVKNPPPPKVTK